MSTDILDQWIPPQDVLRSIGMSEKESYWRRSICQMAYRAVFQGCPIFAGEDAVQEFFRKVADACACLAPLPPKDELVDDIGEPVFTPAEYSRLKGACSRNCEERYAAMREAVAKWRKDKAEKA